MMFTLPVTELETAVLQPVIDFSTNLIAIVNCHMLTCYLVGIVLENFYF